MPATSQAQQRLFSMAEHNPGALYKRNKSLASLPKSTLHDFAATSRHLLPKYAKAKPVTIGSLMKGH